MSFTSIPFFATVIGNCTPVINYNDKKKICWTDLFNNKSQKEDWVNWLVLTPVL